MKIRMDFVTNSSSSSFVAFGILSDELAEFIKRLVKEDYAYSKWCVGEMITDTWDGMVTVVTTMDFYGDYYVYGSDEYDSRTDKQKERDDKKANTEWNIIKKINLFLPTMTEEETEKINQMISDAVANGKTVARTYISETDGYSYPYFREIDFLKMQDKKTSAKWLGELLEKADAMHVETTKKPQTLRAFARSLKISESILSALIQKVYSKNAEEWLHENKYIIGKEEKLELLLKQADEKFKKCGKRPESMRQFVLENGSTKYISDLIMSVHNRQAEEWLIEKGYIVYVSDEEKLSEYLKRADEDFERTKKRPETASEFYNIVEDYYAFTFSRLIHKLYHESAANWLIENGYVVPLSKEEKLAEILEELKKRYPEGSELPGDLNEFQRRNRDLNLYHVKDYYGINLRDWLIANGLLLSNADVRKAKKDAHQKEVENREAERQAQKLTRLEELRKVEKRDESILQPADLKLLNNTLEKLEQYYPEHKVFATDSICENVRRAANKLTKKLGYSAFDEFLYVYGYENISGREVYETRKNCGYTPGNEPELVKQRVDNSIAKLEELYPDYIIEGAIRHKNESLEYTVMGLYQWLGYENLEAFLLAYGFVYVVSAGHKQTFNPNEVIFELLKRYPDGTTTKALQLVDENPDLPMMLVYKNSNRDFGMSLQKYLEQVGIILGKKTTPEEAKANRESEKERIEEVRKSAAEEKAAEEARMAQLVEIAKANRIAYKQNRN